MSQPRHNAHGAPGIFPRPGLIRGLANAALRGVLLAPCMPGPRILIVEDDKQVSLMLGLCLRQEGYRVLETFDGEAGLEVALEERPDLVVLDIDLPKLDGLTVCSELRRMRFDAPILMLTGRGLVDERVSGLDAGADDYLPKPFVAKEFVARLRALLRRRQRDANGRAVLGFGPVRVDLAQRVATRDGQPISLTKTEFALLDLLVSSHGAPVSRETMLDVVWGYTRFPSTRTVDTHIWRLRKKIGDSGEPHRWIVGVAGEGYRLAGQDGVGPVGEPA